MSGEHLWPHWMSPFIPKGAQDRHLETWESFDGTRPTNREARERSGHITTKKLRRVCKDCNNGWMNHIDDDAKSSLLPMMFGNPIGLDRDGQRRVAEFVALKAFVFDNNSREDAVTTLAQRTAFMDRREIPTYTQIHLFHCGEDPWDWQFHRHSGIAQSSNPSTPPHPRTKNIHSMSIGIGALFVYVLQAFAVDIEFRFERLSSRQVWPIVDDAIIWPPPIRATAAEAERITGNMGELIREIHSPR
jgi:hypothetical protein